MQEYASQLIRDWNIPGWAWNLAVVAAAIVAGLLIRLLLRLFARKKAEEQKQFFLFRSVIRHLGGPLAVLIPLIFFSLLFPLMQLPRVLKQRAEHGLQIALIVVIAWTLIRAIRVGQEFTHHKLNIRQKADNLRQRRILTQLIYIRRVAAAIIILFAIGAILLTFSTLRQIGTGLLTGVGIGGIIIGFAAQRSLGNLLAGFQIAFTQPIRIDDEVVVRDEFGTVEEITLTYVVVRIWDERRLVLPINYFIEQPFENWTRTTANMMGTVFFYTDFSMPVEPLRREFIRLVEQHPLWDKRTASFVVNDIRENVMELRGLVSCGSSGHVFDLKVYLREQMMKFMLEHYPDHLPRRRTELMDEDGNEVDEDL